MANYLFTYRVPRDYPAVGPAVAAAWQAFLDGLGPNLVDGGNPVFARKDVGNCSEGTVPRSRSWAERHLHALPTEVSDLRRFRA
jgi:hypothetical protein